MWHAFMPALSHLPRQCGWLPAQLQQRRVRDLEHEAAALRQEIESKDQALAAATAMCSEAQRQVSQLQEELDNNSGERSVGGWSRGWVLYN